MVVLKIFACVISGAIGLLLLLAIASEFSSNHDWEKDMNRDQEKHPENWKQEYDEHEMD